MEKILTLRKVNSTYSLPKNFNTPVVVTSILKNKNRFLILQRSDEVKSMKRKWACVSGYHEKNEDLLSRSLIEIYEETKISYDKLVLRRILDQIHVMIEKNKDLIIQPFYFSSSTKKVILDWEHMNYKWITENEIDNFDFVPKLKEILTFCLS